MKEAYAAEFAATIERAEKQIILARHARRVLNLLDDTPVVPGDVRPAFAHGSQARQILNDAEDDLRDWEPELEEVHIHANKSPTIHQQHQQHQHVAAGSTVDGGSVAGQQTAGSVAPPSTVAMDGSRVGSGGSVTTGAPTSYAPSEATAPVAATAV